MRFVLNRTSLIGLLIRWVSANGMVYWSLVGALAILMSGSPVAALTLAPAVSFAAGNAPQSVAVADLDGDTACPTSSPPMPTATT